MVTAFFSANAPHVDSLHLSHLHRRSTFILVDPRSGAHTSTMGASPNTAELLLRVCADIAAQLVDAHDRSASVSLNHIRTTTCKRYGFNGVPRLTDIIAAIPEAYRKALVPALKAKPVRSASGIAVVAVMCKPHRCPHIALTGNICVYCPGGPDSDFEYSTQSYTGYEARNSSPTRNNRGRSGNGLSSIGLHALTPASAGHIDQNGSHRNHGYSTPRSLPDNVPWAVSYLPDRTGTSHDTCNCGRTTEELTEAEQRLLEGVPTAPGAWVENTDANVPPPPWAPPSRASSPVSGWHYGPGSAREGFRPRGKLAELETPYGSPSA
ncbi:uncharacterized protein PSANT_07053 [Moesziomyces antarcticus]|uniref:ELP3-like N-terminal domain-containing protein n=1 Tax=Pseudozyma antarctica TaxID=84753 RepID=A0A5C3FYN4_PSEA2|nr:uncharacterized protein PSANT_07053 [Moesziomyces antarcticus]